MRSLIVSLSALMLWAPMVSAAHIPTAAPIEQPKAEQQSCARGTAPARIAGSRKKWSRLAAAAICTEDLATISFQEYPADWSAWLDQVSTVWTQSLDTVSGQGLKPSGPLFLELTCNRDGSVSEVVIDRSSGDENCDQTQIKALLRCSPLPAFPTESHKRCVTLLCIWAYTNQTTIAKRPKPRIENAVTRMSITGMTL